MYEYLSIKKNAEYIHSVKNSKFIGYSFYVNSEIEIKEFIKEIKLKHPKANHHCFAWRLGFDKNNYRTNDDGEPAGTAGKPIISRIDSNKITNVLIIVTRYFGGIKLGTSGLIDAYKTTAQNVILESGIETYEVTESLKFNSPIESAFEVFNLLNKEKITYETMEHKGEIMFEAIVKIKHLELLKNKIKDIKSIIIKD